MKAIKLVWAAMVCGALVAGFSSCSKDDDGPNGPAVKMQLEGITIIEGSSTTTLSNFVYDNQGRLTSYDVNDNGDKETVSYTYYSSYIERSSRNGDVEFLLENGVITSERYSNSADMDLYEYSNGNMVKWTEGYPINNSVYQLYLWDNGNPIRETQLIDGSSSSVTSFGYSELLCYIGSLPALFDEFSTLHVELIGNVDPFLQQQGYFGNLPKNLVTSANDGELLWQLSYEVNANGYPTKITGKDENGTAVMTLKWR